MPINVLLMAQEPTKGIKSFGPKVLLDINTNKKILDYHIQNFISMQKNANIITSVGFDKEKIHKYLNNISNNKRQINNTLDCKHYHCKNEGYVLKQYLHKYPKTNKLLIVPAGVLFKKNTILKKHINKKSTIFLLNKYLQNFEKGCSIQDGQIKYIFFDLEYCWTECVYLNSEAIDILKTQCNTKGFENKFLFEIVNNLIEKNIHFEYEIINSNKFIKINHIKEIKKAKTYT